MGNIKNFNFNKLDLKLSNSDYWDFFLATDEGPTEPCNGLTSGDCFVVWYDFNNPSVYSGTSIYSLVSWNGATNSGYTMNTIGLTGLDNGLITFDKLSGDTDNQALLLAMTGSTLVIPSGDTRLMLNRVTGTTGNFIYPISYTFDPTATVGDYLSFSGGFYQGYYKLDGNSYEVLPVRVSNAWSAEFWLNPSNLVVTGNTLNNSYPNNKGFFFYMGTRAENKYWNVFEGVDSGCTSGCTTGTGCTDTLSSWCTIIKETDVVLVGDYGVGIPLSPPQVEIDIETNGFLIYGRAYNDRYLELTGATDSFMFSGLTPTNTNNCGGCTGPNDGLGNQRAGSYDGEGLVVVRTSKVITNEVNPFLIYGRAYESGVTSGTTGTTCGGCPGPNDGLGNQRAGSFSGFTTQEVEIDYNLDIIDSALGFRIKDDGSIGYRLLTVTGKCNSDRSYTSGVTIEEGYSVSGMVVSNSWSYIAIRFVTEYQNECQLKTSKPRTGKLMFYVNGKLKFVDNEFSELIAKRLHEYKSKQVGVPFNFSLGGGSQGLLESQTFDGLDSADRGLPIETNFAGTFIGGISQFKFNICDLTFCDIQYNYIMDSKRYGQDTNFILDENGFLILQENGYGMQ